MTRKTRLALLTDIVDWDFSVINVTNVDNVDNVANSHEMEGTNFSCVFA